MGFLLDEQHKLHFSESVRKILVPYPSYCVGVVEWCLFLCVWYVRRACVFVCSAGSCLLHVVRCTYFHAKWITHACWLTRVSACMCVIVWLCVCACMCALARVSRTRSISPGFGHFWHHYGSECRPSLPPYTPPPRAALSPVVCANTTSIPPWYEHGYAYAMYICVYIIL
jgi:hypothetical protein